MGIDYNALRSILYIKKERFNFSSVATIGRQGVHLNKNAVKVLLNKFGYNISSDDINNILSTGYAEGLFKYFGAKKIDSFDFSDYEGATFIHDMNRDIRDDYKNRYDLVFDGGTLEHVFNFPVAIKNCMEMVRIGGIFMSITPTDNFSGHGFYQFSPELFFRIFDSVNGFKILYIGISEGNKWFSVKDPNDVRSRVTFRSRKETYMIVISQKLEDKYIFKNTPLQSDYVSLWNDHSIKISKRRRRGLHSLRNFSRRFITNHFIRFNKTFFKKEGI